MILDKITATVIIKNKLGLHARAAASFVKIAAKFDCSITVKKDDTEVNGKSITSLIMLCATQGASLEIQAQGNGAEMCIKELQTLVDNNFGEKS